MAEITWIKLRTNMFDDEKIKLIERLPEGDGILVVWIKLLAHAGKSNCNGYIMISENIPMNIDEVAAIFNRPFEKVKYAIAVLQKYKMIDVTEEDVISITNWDKHQNIEGMDKIRAQNRERKRLERERKKTLLLDNSFDESCHVTVTGSHAIDIEEDIDKEKDIKHTQQAAELESQFEQFWSLYPKKVDKKTAFNKFKLKLKKHDFDTIIKGTASYAKVMQLNNTDKQYIKGAAKFLNNENYLDDQSELLTNKSSKQNKNTLFNPWEVQDARESNQTNLFDNSGSIPTTVKTIGFGDVL